MNEPTLVLALCAPAIYPMTAQAIIRHESGNHQFSIGVNGQRLKISRQPTTYEQAVSTAKLLIGQGLSVDMGYAQINSRNLQHLGLTIESIFDACANVNAMQSILSRSYTAEAARPGDVQLALQAALSGCNTGNRSGGMAND